MRQPKGCLFPLVGMGSSYTADLLHFQL
jgi:hypothetical protein